MKRLYAFIIFFGCICWSICSCPSFAAEEFSLYGISFSMDYAQILQNGLDREYIVSATTIPKEFKDDVGQLSNHFNPIPYGTPVATGISEKKVDVVEENYLSLEALQVGLYKIDTICYEISNKSGEHISTIRIFFFTDKNGLQAPTFLNVNTEAFQEVLQTLRERYGTSEQITPNHRVKLAWDIGDVFVCTSDALHKYDGSSVTEGVFSAIQIPVMKKFINFVYDEIFRLSQEKNAQKAVEDAQRHRDRLEGI